MKELTFASVSYPNSYTHFSCEIRIQPNPGFGAIIENQKKAYSIEIWEMYFRKRTLT
jgi:hypothetical protein